MAAILNIPNSFVTFYNLSNNLGIPEYVTDTECGIQKDFCYPIYDEKDLAFQVNIASSEVLTSGNVDVQIIPASGTGITLTGYSISIVANGTYGGSTPIYNIYINFFGSDLTNAISEGDCFKIGILTGGIIDLAYFVSNQCFKKVNDKCLTTKLQYINTSNAFGFVYRSFGTFPNIALTLNRIRLPLYFKEPNISSDKTVYVRPDGSRQLLSARLAKRYKGMIDEVPEETHQNLVIALNHDGIYFTPENFTTQIQARFEDEYNNNYPEIMQNVNIWSADFTIFETPFNNFNSNCG
jgi:hypothetical protein